ncbi:MAG: CNNM domain-containing protein [Planctomycetia bacterium]|nr:CNNM domain-containing protein [Planctomycetia bacterium]
MIVELLLFCGGLLLSAFFSGAETGFYRVPRVRLVIDSVGGDPLARGLLWLTLNPSLFVATALVGINLADYFISLATVMATHRVWPDAHLLSEVVIPLVLSPIVFVYGELLPKNLFYRSPHRLLRMTGPLFIFGAVLFLPITALLWGAGKLLEWTVGVSPQLIKRRLARAELKRVLDEGQQAGILRPAQRALAQGLFAVAPLTVRNAMTPASRVTTVREGTSRDEALRLARRHGLSALAIESPKSPGQPLGYVRIADLYLGERTLLGAIRPLMTIAETEPHITALMRIQAAGASLARVIDARQRTVGYITPRQLTEPLLRGGA